MWDVLPSQMHSRGATAILLGPAKVRGGGAYGVSFLGGAWLASSAALSVLVFLLSGAIRLIDGGWIDMDGGVNTLVSCLASGCAAASLGLSWCFFWRLVAWSPAFNSPCLRTGVWAQMWLLHEALLLVCVQGSINWAWCMVWCVVVVVW